MEQILAFDPRVAALFLDLGQDPGLRKRAEYILSEMRSLVRAKIVDFASFRTAVVAAAEHIETPAKRFEVRNGELLDAVLAAGNDERAVLEILNRDPVHSQIPFVEQIPVERGGATVWITPIEHSHVQKRPSDVARFEQLIESLRNLYEHVHPARTEHPRLNVLDAMARLSRELKRDHCYLPAVMQLVEARVASFEGESVQPAALASGKILTSLLLGCERIQVQCRRRWIEKAFKAGLRREAAELGALYLDQRSLHRRWLTSYILDTLLAPAHLDIRWRPSVSKSVALVRNELQTGSYDGHELASRVRKLEAKGLYISSLAFPLLQLHTDGADEIPAKTKKALAP